MTTTIRSKGQDVRVTLTSPAGTVDVINESGVKSADIAFKMKILDEGYLGEATNRKDDIFEGVSGNIEAHLAKSAYFALVEQVIARAQRRSPAEGVFNMMMSINYGTGQRSRIIVEDVSFGELPVNIGGRDEYVTVRIQFEASGGRFIL